MTAGPSLAPTFAVIILAGWWMVEVSVAKRMLEPRGPRLNGSLPAKAVDLGRRLMRWARG